MSAKKASTFPISGQVNPSKKPNNEWNKFAGSSHPATACPSQEKQYGTADLIYYTSVNL